MSRRAPLGLIALAILLRWLVAQFSYSGQNKPPMYGDYEAQRHWMEITTNLPPRQWYTNTTDNDLMYWGLDYPPLTAYHMFSLGWISQRFINSSWTELHASRGFESYDHKLFMRSSVILGDLLIYIPAITCYFYKLDEASNNAQQTYNQQKLDTVIHSAMLMMYPAQILVDHGHFQYNSIFMGLALWAVIFMIKRKQFLSSIAFTLALGYKQMSLYYALPFFWFIASSNLRVRPIWKGLIRVLGIGLVVISVFAIMFLPYIHSIDLTLQVLRRIFPFNRGLFEDKVANFWFSLSIFYKYRNIYSIEELLKASTAMTLLVTLPAGIHLLVKPTIRTFKYSLVTTSLAFFLFSFQVHEKTILVPALPILLLSREHPQASNWFVIISTFSLQPLLIKDGQVVPYFVLLTIYTLLSIDAFSKHVTPNMKKLFCLHNFVVTAQITSILACFTLSIVSLLVPSPPQYPYIHPTLNALFSGGHFMAFLIYFYARQFMKQPMKTGKILSKKTN